MAVPAVTTPIEVPLARAGKHIDSLDGLRAVAILMVIVLHHQLFPQGWVGVNIFFVLSGYLITTGLRIARTELHFWKRFYVKRAARILPPCLAALFICEVVYRPAHTNFALYVFLLGNYADASIRFMIPSIAVLWSLAVEEHFYLLQPFAVRYLNRRRCAVLFGSILVIEPILRAIFSSHEHGNYIYFLTPFRLDGLSAGALLALLMESERGRLHVQRYAWYYGLAVAAIIVSLSICFPATFTLRARSRLFDSIGFSLVALGAMALIAYVLTHPKSIISRVLQWRVLVFVGTISYGMYLSHIFLLDAVQALWGMREQAALAISLPLTILVSWLSYRYYERPLILSGRNWLAREGYSGHPVR